MKAKFGIFCMILGAALVLGALGLAVYNQNEAVQAEQISASVLPELMDKIRQEQSENVTEPPTQQIPESLRTADDVKMSEMVIDGQRYIGFLSLPGLELELPVPTSVEDVFAADAMVRKQTREAIEMMR